MALDANTQLLFHITPIVIGFIIMMPFGEALTAKLATKFPSLTTARGRLLGGMKLVMLGGFTVSVHTFWIHNKAKELGAGEFCSGESLFDCSSVIGNDAWNTMPIIGLPWGVIGMIAFAVFMWLIISISKEPNATWVVQHIKIGKVMGILGLVMMLYLFYAEFSIGKLCQYCTVAHLAHAITTFGFFRLENMFESSGWNPTNAAPTGKRQARRPKRGFVPPIPSEEE
jgi:uncharacterized membrane protein